MNKDVVTVLFSVILFCSSTCMAFGFAGTNSVEGDTSMRAHWPVIVNKYSEHLGLFGGIASGYNQNGDLESAMLLTDALGNGLCDKDCYVESCYFGRGDCDNLSPADRKMMLSTICSPGCDTGDIGDGFCDKACDTQACQHGGGDCVQQ